MIELFKSLIINLIINKFKKQIGIENFIKVKKKKSNNDNN